MSLQSIIKRYFTRYGNGVWYTSCMLHSAAHASPDRIRHGVRSSSWHCRKLFYWGRPWAWHGCFCSSFSTENQNCEWWAYTDAPPRLPPWGFHWYLPFMRIIRNWEFILCPCWFGIHRSSLLALCWALEWPSLSITNAGNMNWSCKADRKCVDWSKHDLICFVWKIDRSTFKLVSYWGQINDHHPIHHTYRYIEKGKSFETM